MNNPHQNARTTRLARTETIRRILDEGQPLREVASGLVISERTAGKWQARFKAEGPSGLENRSYRPRAFANRTAEYWIGVIERLRREYRLIAEQIASELMLLGSPEPLMAPDAFGPIRSHLPAHPLQQAGYPPVVVSSIP
jgi:hypothetical protein